MLISFSGSGDCDLDQPSTCDPKQFIRKGSMIRLIWIYYVLPKLYPKLTFNIMEQAVAPCPEITMTIKGHKTRSLTDMGSEVTLMNESYCKQYIEPLILTLEQDMFNIHKLFSLKGVKDGCVPLSMYFTFRGLKLLQVTRLTVKFVRLNL